MKTNKKNTVTILKYVGVDDWGNNKYKDKNGRIYVDVANSKDPRFPANLHTVTRDWGEPCKPVHFDNIKVTGWTDEDQAQKVFQFEYMMLSALQMKISSYKSWGYTKEGIIKDLHSREEYLPPSVKKRNKRKESIKRARRLAAKRRRVNKDK